MTSKERILSVLNGIIPDRVPVSLYKIDPFDENSFWAKHESFKNLLEVAKKIQDTFHFYRPKTGFFFSSPDSVDVKVEEFQDTRISKKIKLTVETELGPLTRIARQTLVSSFEWVEKPWVENHHDIEKFLTLPYTPFKPDISDFYKIQANLGDRGIMVVALPDPVGVCGTLFAPGTLSHYLSEYPSLIYRLVENFYIRLKDLYTFISQNIEGAIIRIRGAEFLTPPTLPAEYHDVKALFNDLIIKYDRVLIEILKMGRKNYISYHWHDNISELLPQVLKMGPDIIEPVCNSIEKPNLILRIKRMVGESVVIMGGLTADVLEFRSREEVNSMVKEAILQGARRGRFLLIPSGVPTSAPLSPNLEENYIEFLQAGYNYGKYPLG